MTKIKLLNPNKAKEIFVKYGWNDYSIKVSNQNEKVNIVDIKSFTEQIDSAKEILLKFSSEYIISLEKYSDNITIEFEDIEKFGSLLKIDSKPIFLAVYRSTKQSDLNKLKKYPNLGIIEFRNSENLTDIRPLASLGNLTNLNLEWCENLTDIRPLASLGNLTNLNLLGCNNLKVIRQLSSLVNLTNLNLGRCVNITDILSLASLVNLTDLDLSLTFNLTDITPLASLGNLTNLELHDCEYLKDISPLASLVNLTKLNLDWSNNLTDITPLASLGNLNKLNLNCCERLFIINPLIELKILEVLGVYNCHNIRDIEKLENCFSLKELTDFEDKVLAHQILMSCAYKRKDIEYIKDNFEEWNQSVELAKSHIEYISYLLYSISLIDISQRKEYLLSSIKRIRERGLQSDKNENELKIFLIEHWCSLALALTKEDTKECIEALTNALDYKKELELILGPSIVSLSDFVKEHPQERLWAIDWVENKLSVIIDEPQQERIIAPSVAVFWASLSEKEKVLLWIEKGTIAQVPQWRDKILKALVFYHSSNNKFAEAKELISQIELDEIKDEAIKKLSIEIAKVYPIEGTELLDTISNDEISVETAKELLKNEKMYEQPQTIYQLLLHLQNNADELAICMQAIIENGKDEKITKAINELFLTKKSNTGLSTNALLRLCNYEIIKDYIKPKALENFKNRLEQEIDKEVVENVEILLSKLKEENLIDEEEVKELKEKI